MEGSLLFSSKQFNIAASFLFTSNAQTIYDTISGRDRKGLQINKSELLRFIAENRQKNLYLSRVQGL